MDMRALTLQQKQQLIGLLEIACEKLELTDTQQRHAKERYEVVGAFLGDGGEPLLANVEISPQGSIRLRTSTKPIGREEFDVDLICHAVDAGTAAPDLISKLVGDRLRGDATYRRMLEPLKRGWRLNYANEFHLDITPAVADVARGGTAILVPDAGSPGGKPSNPKGYAKWFDVIAALQPRITSRTLEKAAMDRAHVEPLPDFGGFKGILRRSVQIFKRDRDLLFCPQAEQIRKTAPISILLTTLAAHSYRDCVAQRSYDSELDLFQDVLAHMPDYVEQRAHGGQLMFWVPNPTNSGENFAEKWNLHPERAGAFYEWHRRAVQNVHRLTQQIGLDEINKALGQTLGAKVSDETISEYSTRLGRAREAGRLRYAPAVGILATASAAAAVRANTFFGAP